MPRKTTEEMIADLEAKLAKARGSAVERVKTQIEKLEEKSKLIDERIAKLTAQKEDISKEISSLRAPAQSEDDAA